MGAPKLASTIGNGFPGAVDITMLLVLIYTPEPLVIPKMVLLLLIEIRVNEVGNTVVLNVAP